MLYTPEMMKRLTASVQTLPAEDRIGLLSDAYATCKAGLASPVGLIDLMKGFFQEKNDEVGACACACACRRSVPHPLDFQSQRCKLESQGVQK